MLDRLSTSRRAGNREGEPAARALRSRGGDALPGCGGWGIRAHRASEAHARSRRSRARPGEAGAPFKQQLTQLGDSQTLSIVLPEQVHGADQPVFVSRHDPRGAAIGPETLRTPGPPTSEMLWK